MKVRKISEATTLGNIPNIGPAMIRDLASIGIREPQDLRNQDGYELYVRLCAATHTRHDPCVLDTFLAVTDFANGAQSAPWWRYTAKHKQKYPNL